MKAIKPLKSFVLNSKGVMLFELLIGLFILSLFIPLITRSYLTFQTLSSKSHSIILAHTEIDYIRDVMYRDIKNCSSIEVINLNECYLISNTGAHISYSLSKNRLKRRVNHQMTQYLTQFTSVEDMFYEINQSLLTVKLIFSLNQKIYNEDILIFCSSIND